MWEVIRVAAGLLVGAVTAATLFVMGWPIVTGRRLFPANISERHIWLTACVVALAYAVVLGLPAYAVVRWLRLTPWWISLICGFIIGAAPTAIAFWTGLSGIGSPDFLLIVLPVGICGSLGGFMAWLIWYLL